MATSWAPEDKVVKGCIAFLLWWLLAVFPALPLLPIGRTAGSLVGACLMVLFGVITPDAAFAAIDLPILGLLFATMVISIYLERVKAFEYLAQALSWKTQGATDLLIRVCILAAFSSALFTNDSTCVVLTGFVLKLCTQSHLTLEPFLVALATSSNIGSALTPIGNPQNLVIAVQGKLGFWQFVLGMLPAVVIGMVCNIAGLLLVYGRSLSLPSLAGEQLDRGHGINGVEEEEAGTQEALLMPSLSFNVEGGECRRRDSNPWLTIVHVIKHKEGFLKVAGFVFLVGVWLVGATMHTFEAGVGLPWTAITAALLLTVVDFEDATKSLDKVLHSFILIAGLCICTADALSKQHSHKNVHISSSLLSHGSG